MELMINFTEANRWAKSIGYKITKKDDIFHWIKLSDTTKGSQSNNISSVVKQIYNDYTDNKWVDHQNSFQGIVK